MHLDLEPVKNLHGMEEKNNRAHSTTRTKVEILNNWSTQERQGILALNYWFLQKIFWCTKEVMMSRSNRLTSNIQLRQLNLIDQSNNHLQILKKETRLWNLIYLTLISNIKQIEREQIRLLKSKNKMLCNFIKWSQIFKALRLLETSFLVIFPRGRKYRR